MLPFLKRNQKSVAGVIVHNRTPDEKPEENQDDKSEVRAAISALRDALDILEAMVSDKKEESNDFHSRNQAAASESEE